MRAMAIKTYGGPHVLESMTVPTPECKDNTVLIKIAAASINPVDWKIRKGMLRFILPARFPVILGYDICGQIVEVGKNVTEFKINDWVMGQTHYLTGRGYAEFIAVSPKYMVKKPENISVTEAAAIPLASLTALQAIRNSGKLTRGEHVLIIGASGGVGSFAVQLAKVLGAYVTAVTSTANLEWVKSLGADEVIDYTQQNILDPLKKYDLVFDAVAKYTFKQVQPILLPAGRYVTTVPNLANIMSMLGNPFRKQKCHNIIVKNRPADLKYVTDLVAKGRVKPVIDSVFNWEKAAEAHEKSEKGHARGKIVLEIGENTG